MHCIVFIIFWIQPCLRLLLRHSNVSQMLCNQSCLSRHAEDSETIKLTQPKQMAVKFWLCTVQFVFKREKNKIHFERIVHICIKMVCAIIGDDCDFLWYHYYNVLKTTGWLVCRFLLNQPFHLFFNRTAMFVQHFFKFLCLPVHIIPHQKFVIGYCGGTNRRLCL